MSHAREYTALDVKIPGSENRREWCVNLQSWYSSRYVHTGNNTWLVRPCLMFYFSTIYASELTRLNNEEHILL